MFGLASLLGGHAAAGGGLLGGLLGGGLLGGGLLGGLLSNPTNLLMLGLLGGSLFGDRGSGPQTPASDYVHRGFTGSSPVFPDDSYRPGKDDEWDYFPMAEGGPVHGTDSRYWDRYHPMAHGGAIPKAPQPGDVQLIQAARLAIQGKIPNAQSIIVAFVQRFGQAALADLASNQGIRQGMGGEPQPMMQGPQAMPMQGPMSMGMDDTGVSGPGDGQSDSIPAMINGRAPAALSDGEFVVPADVVSGIGAGSTAAGVRMLQEMIERVRKGRTGSASAPKQVSWQQMAPA